MTGKDKNAWVEDLLTNTSLEFSDEGFSNRVLAGLHTSQNRRLKILAPFFALGIASLLAFFPYGALSALGPTLALNYTSLMPALIPAIGVLGMVLFFNFAEEAA